MANKYLIHGATYCGDGTASNEAASAAATAHKGRCRSATQAYCCADEHANTKSGRSSIRATTLANVREHLRTVSRAGHSHAESMCACPVASTR